MFSRKDNVKSNEIGYFRSYKTGFMYAVGDDGTSFIIEIKELIIR